MVSDQRTQDGDQHIRVAESSVVSVLADVMAAEACKELQNDGDSVLSTRSDLDDQVLKMLRVVSDAKKKQAIWLISVKPGPKFLHYISSLGVVGGWV